MAAQPHQTLRARTSRWLTRETSSDLLLLVTATLGVAWANSPWRDSYHALSGTVVRPAAWHLDLSLAAWAADGLLAVFFFIVGLELKQELVVGSLRDPRRAAVPALTAVGGMVVPAAVFITSVALTGDRESLHGWAIPTATDIAFAMAVLAIFGRGLPLALRTFLLTLAVVDDLLAILVIAVFYTDTLDLAYLVIAAAVILVFAAAVRLLRPSTPLLPTLAFAAWTLVHASGVHATVAGVALGLVVPATALQGEARPRSTRYEHALRPFVFGTALPVFAFFSAGVTIVGGEGPAAVLSQPVVLAIVLGLVLGKLVGVLGTAALVTRGTRLRLPRGIGLRDLLPAGFLAGIGFTVSLLIAEPSFADGQHTAGAKVAILLGSTLAAGAAAVTLRLDVRHARSADMNRDGIPDNITEFVGDHPDGDADPRES